MFLKYWREILILGLLATVSFQYTRPQTVERLVETERVVEIRIAQTKEKVVYRDRETKRETTTFNKDGTVKKKTVEDTTVKSGAATNETETNHSTTYTSEVLEEKITSRVKTYSLGFSNSILNVISIRDMELHGAARLADSPFWLELNAQPSTSRFHVGVRYEF